MNNIIDTTYDFKKINVFTGPMFSGKTRLIIDFIKENRYKCVVYSHYSNKHKHDNEEKKVISSRAYDTVVSCIKINNLLELCNSRKIDEFKTNDIKYLVFDEIQFFDDLIEFIEYYKNYEFIILLFGLELDYKKEKFGFLYKLEGNTDVTYNRLTGKCTFCNKKSIYTIRTIDYSNRILIGDEFYTPSCSDCYDKYSIL
jgi:thymidine kinase